MLWRRKTKKQTNNEEEYRNIKKEYDFLISVTLTTLKFPGIRLTVDRNKPVSVFLWRLYLAVEGAFVSVSLASELVHMAERARAGTFQDAVIIFKMVPCAGYCALALFKSYNMVFYRRVFEHLTSELASMWPRRASSSEDLRVFRYTVTQLRWIVRGYFTCNVMTMLIFFGVPVKRFLESLFGGEVELKLPFYMWLPFDPIENGYAFLLFALIYYGTMVVLVVMGNDLLFCIFLSQISMQLDLLSNRIEKLIYVPCDRMLIKDYPLGTCDLNTFRRPRPGISLNTRKDLEKETNRKLTEIILRHRSLIRLSDDVESQFSFPLLVNVINGSLIICFCGFCCLLVEKWSDFTYKFFLAMALSQTWVLCWYGQRLLDSSFGISSALYNCGWYISDSNTKRTIIFMMCRAQKQIHVTTYGFSVICLNSFTTIVKSAWSYFMLLMNLYF